MTSELHRFHTYQTIIMYVLKTKYLKCLVYAIAHHSIITLYAATGWNVTCPCKWSRHLGSTNKVCLSSKYLITANLQTTLSGSHLTFLQCEMKLGVQLDQATLFYSQVTCKIVLHRHKGLMFSMAECACDMLGFTKYSPQFNFYYTLVECIHILTICTVLRVALLTQ